MRLLLNYFITVSNGASELGAPHIGHPGLGVRDRRWEAPEHQPQQPVPHGDGGLFGVEHCGRPCLWAGQLGEKYPCHAGLDGSGGGGGA